MFSRARPSSFALFQLPRASSVTTRLFAITPSSLGGVDVQQARRQAGGNVSQGPLQSSSHLRDPTIPQARGLSPKEMSGELEMQSASTASSMPDKDREMKGKGVESDYQPALHSPPDYMASAIPRVAADQSGTERHEASAQGQGLIAEAKEKMKDAAEMMKGVAHKAAAKVADAATALKDKTDPHSSTSASASGGTASPTDTSKAQPMAVSSEQLKKAGMDDLYKSKGRPRDWSEDQKSREL